MFGFDNASLFVSIETNEINPSHNHRPSKDVLSGSGDAKSKDIGGSTKKIPQGKHIVYASHNYYSYFLS